MRHLILTAFLLASPSLAPTLAQTAPAPASTPAVPTPTTPAATAAIKVEIQDVEITAPASTGTTPTVQSDDVGEVTVPVLASSKDGSPLAGVAVTWEVKNTGKAPIYVISSQAGDQVTPVAATIAPGETAKYETVTGTNGMVTLLLNATASTAAVLKLTTSTGEVKNLRSAAQTIDWIGQ